VNGSPSSKFLFACGARTCHFPSLRCSEWSGWRRVCVFPRHPESRLSGRLWHRPRGPAAYSLPLTYLKILRARRLCWLECRPELRNHGAGWMRAVERLRNGGVPRDPVFLMPATHCSQNKGRKEKKANLLSEEDSPHLHPSLGLSVFFLSFSPHLHEQDFGLGSSNSFFGRRSTPASSTADKGPPSPAVPLVEPVRAILL